MDNRGIALKNINNYLATFTQHIRQQNSSGKFDINKDAENIAINLLNAVYGLRLKNANKVFSDNFHAIDLIDDTNLVAIQVTSDNRSSKIVETIKKFLAKNLYKKYKKLYIYVLTSKKNYTKVTAENVETIISGKFDFNLIEDVIDNATLGSIIDGFQDLNKILNLENILRLEFGNSNKVNLLKSTDNDEPKFLFDYRNRLTNFIGRENELSELNDFFNSDNDFSWWLITGKAGSGKSRLALEFANRLEKLGVNSGFLPLNHIDSFDWNTNYQRPMLIIIDYVQSNHKPALNLIVKLSNKTNYENKIRLLLIERVTTEDWWKDFINNIYASKKLFNNNPLEVNGLHTDILFKIIQEIVYEKNRNLVLDKDEIVDSLVKIDPLKRPLFSMFAGVALANNQRISNWNQSELLGFLIDEDYRRTKETFKEYDDTLINKHRDLLAVCTVCYGVNGYEIDRIFEKKFNWLPTLTEFDDNLYSFISYNSTLEDNNKWMPDYPTSQPNESKKSIQLSPLLPDVLGEYFVLKRLEKSEKFKFRDQNKSEEFIELAESVNHYYYIIFLRKLLQDFPTHAKVIDFLKGNRNGMIDIRGVSGSILLEAMKYLYYNNAEYLKTLLEYTRVLSTTINTKKEQKSYMDDPDRVYQEACKIMVFKNSGNLTEQVNYYKLIKSNTDNFEKEPKAFYDASAGHDENFDFAQIEKDYANMDNKEYAEEYLSKKLVTDERIPHIEVIAINCILLTSKSSIDKITADLYIERMFYLCKKFTYPRIKVDTIATYIDYGANHIENFSGKIDKLFSDILLTPAQIGPVNVADEQYTFVNKLIEYKISIRDSYGALDYYRKFKFYLFSLKPSNNIGITLTKLALTAKTYAKNFYEKRIFITGDLFYNEILHINSVINTPPSPINPMNEIISKVNNYRNGDFD